jgi:hypothetical protein
MLTTKRTSSIMVQEKYMRTSVDIHGKLKIIKWERGMKI